MASLKNSIYNLIKNSTHAVAGGEIEDYARGEGYTASNALRRCRELVNEGKLYATYKRGHVHYQLPTQISQAQAQIKEQGPEPLFDNAPEVPAKPVTLSKKVSTLWEGARSRVGGRPRYSERSQAGPSERFSESTALVQELSRFKDLKYTKEPNYILREGA